MEVRPRWFLPNGTRPFSQWQKMFCPLAQDLTPRGKNLIRESAGFRLQSYNLFFNLQNF
jgi:hypothetical protein